LHFIYKNTRETTFSFRKMPLIKVKRYLEGVLAQKQVIPFRHFCGGGGRTTQAKNRHSNGQGRCPAKSAKFILDLLKMQKTMLMYLTLSKKEEIVKKDEGTHLAPKKKFQVLRSGTSS
ncbi:hypothetical protein MKX01_013909, partial [Papaver californicum]